MPLITRIESKKDREKYSAKPGISYTIYTQFYIVSATCLSFINKPFSRQLTYLIFSVDNRHDFRSAAYTSLYPKLKIMTYIISQPENHQFHIAYKQKKSFITRFIQWATDEDKERHIVWVGASITAMAAVFFPLTMSVILANGASFGLIITAMFSLSLVVVTNLAAMPTRYTIPFFFVGILIDVCAVTIALL